jgi:hypothetical protein
MCTEMKRWCFTLGFLLNIRLYPILWNWAVEATGGTMHICINNIRHMESREHEMNLLLYHQEKYNTSFLVNLLFSICVLPIKEKLNCTFSKTYRPTLFRWFGK